MREGGSGREREGVGVSEGASEKGSQVWRRRRITRNYEYVGKGKRKREREKKNQMGITECQKCQQHIQFMSKNSRKRGTDLEGCDVGLWEG